MGEVICLEIEPSIQQDEVLFSKKYNESRNVLDLELQRGTVYISDLYNYFNIQADMYLYCNTFVNDVPEGTIKLEELAPSMELMFYKNSLLQDNKYIKEFKAFKRMYLNELTKRDECKLALEQLKDYLKKGKSIVLFDDCELGAYCHLNILKERLYDLGFRIKSF